MHWCVVGEEYELNTYADGRSYNSSVCWECEKCYFGVLGELCIIL